ncbi:lipopolysaccharide biosynthesis protein [Pedobacter sp. NJ-S-72]
MLLSINADVGTKFVFNKKLLKNVGRFAGGMLLISIVAAVNTQLDKIAISKFLPISELGFYNIAISLSQVLVVIVSPISVALLPHFTSLYSIKKTEEASDLFESVFLIVSVLVFVLGGILMFFSTDLIYVWTNNKTVALSSSNYIFFSTLGTAMLAMQVVPFDIVIANGHTKINNVIGLLSLFVSVPAYWLSVSIYGPKGAAITWCIIQTVTTPIFLYFVVNKFLKEISFMKLFFRQLILPAAVAIATAYGLSLLFMDHFQGKIFTLVQISLATLITFTVVILICVPFIKIKQIFLMLKREKEL